LRVTAWAAFVSPGGLTLVNVPPATISEPTWANAFTVPLLMFGVLVDGAALTSEPWLVPDAAAIPTCPTNTPTASRASPMLAALFRMF